MNLFDLAQSAQFGNQPRDESVIKEQVVYEKEYFRKHFPLANLTDKLMRKLNDNSRAYKKNFKLMWKFRNKDNLEFVKIEKKLNRKDILIRKEMMIFTSGGRSTKKLKPGEEYYE